MKPKLLELAKILKQKPEIKERLERLEIGCWIKFEKFKRAIQYTGDIGIFVGNQDFEIIGFEPAYHDVLEYLGGTYFAKYYLRFDGIYAFKRSEFSANQYQEKVIYISPGALSDQTDEKIGEIISLCKNVGEKK